MISMIIVFILGTLFGMCIMGIIVIKELGGEENVKH